MESLKLSKFKLEEHELRQLHGGLQDGAGWHTTYEWRDTAPEDGGGCDRMAVDICVEIQDKVGS